MPQFAPAGQVHADFSTWLGENHVLARAQQLRARHEIDQSDYAIVKFAMPNADTDEVLSGCQDLWGFDAEVGWWEDRQVAAVLLQDTCSEEAVQLADQLGHFLRLPSIEVHCSDISEGREDLPGVALLPCYDLFAKPMPGWKRAFDVVIGGAFCLAALPLLLVLAGLVRLTSKGPAFFLQARVGIGGKPFKMYKLRTMYLDAEQRRAELEDLNEQSGSAFKIAKDPRVTPIGRLLRASSLDELPQLLNVVEGTMSMVGPRPLPVADWYPKNPRHIRRHDVTPGITCTWQISGRAEIPFDEWMEMDLSYIAKHTLLGDAAILAKTVVAVLSGRGAV